MNISVKKLALLAIASVFSAGLWAQKKELTLDEVFLSPGKFKPEAYSGVQWSPSGAQWAHYDAETEELALETPKGYTSRVTASDLEKSLGKNVSSVPSAYSWKDYDNIYFEFPSYVVKYTLSAKKAEIVLSWDESIKGVHVSPVKDAVAYSKDGNVYYSKDGNTVRVTSDGGNGIVSPPQRIRYRQGYFLFTRREKTGILPQERKYGNALPDRQYLFAHSYGGRNTVPYGRRKIRGSGTLHIRRTDRK